MYGPQNRGTAQLYAEDGEKVLKTRDETRLNRFARHFDQLLNVPGSADRSTLDELACHSDDHRVRRCPELCGAADMSSTRENKAPGRCGILAEVWKHGGTNLQEQLHDVIVDIWEKEQVPQNWKDANIIPIFKKVIRKECGNYQGISLLLIAGKILACVILNRINTNTCICPHILPETQCGFPSNRSTIDMVFCLQQIQEECTEQNVVLYAVFTDFTKAFDTVSRGGMALLCREEVGLQ